MISVLALAAAASAAVMPVASSAGDWTFEDNLEGEHACIINQLYDDGTRIMLVVDGAAHEQGLFGFFAFNPSWSVRRGTLVSDITISAPAYQFGTDADGLDHGFYLPARMIALEPFLDAAAQGGFDIVRKSDRYIGRYDAAGIDQVIDDFRGCIARLPAPGSDPFAG